MRGAEYVDIVRRSWYRAFNLITEVMNVYERRFEYYYAGHSTYNAGYL